MSLHQKVSEVLQEETEALVEEDTFSSRDNNMYCTLATFRKKHSMFLIKYGFTLLTLMYSGK